MHIELIMILKTLLIAEPADVLLKGTVVLILTTALAWILHRATAATRHLVWLGGMLSLLILPLASLCMPVWHILPRHAVMPSSTLIQLPAAITNAESVKAISQVKASSLSANLAASHFQPTDDAAQKPVELWPSILLVVWLVGVLIASLPFAIASFYLRKICHHDEPVTDVFAVQILHDLQPLFNLPRPIRLLRGRANVIPMTFGLRNPCILVPAESVTWPPSRWRAVLLHECAHIARRDVASLFLSRITAGLWWFHPLAWWCHLRLAAEAEKSCDDVVLVNGISAADYAEELVMMATAFKKGATMGAVSMARASTLRTRIRAVMNEKQRRSMPKSRYAFAKIAFGCLCVLPLAAISWANGQTPPPSASAPSTQAGVASTASDTSWLRTYSDGTKVELLTIGDSNVNSSWKPDGILIHASANNFAATTPTAVVRISGSPDLRMCQLLWDDRPLKERTVVYGDGAEKFYVDAVVLPQSQIGDLRVGISVGEWSTVWQGDKPTEGKNTLGSYWITNLWPFSDAKADFRITVSSTFRDQDVVSRLTIVDANGKTQELYPAGNREAVGPLTTTEYMHIGRDKNKSPEFHPIAYRLETRPVEWVTFKQVHTAPLSEEKVPSLIEQMRKRRDAQKEAATQASIAVDVTTKPSSNFYYIMGAVQRPGVYDMSAKSVTLLQALAAAGVDAKLVDDQRIRIRLTHQKSDEKPLDTNMQEVYQSWASPMLVPGDVIMVRDPGQKTASASSQASVTTHPAN